MRVRLLTSGWLFGAILILSKCSAQELANEQLGSKAQNVDILSSGTKSLQTSSLSIDLLRMTGTVAGLRPVAQPSFDYTPGDLLAQRSSDTYYHLGDLDLRIRRPVSPEWTVLSTAFRRQQAQVLSDRTDEFRTDITKSLPQNAGLRVIRTWRTDQNELQLQFDITNTGSSPVELGGVGMAMVFNNFLNGRTLEQAYERCSFYDPYIGQDAGYVQVVPLKGTGPVLLIAPLGKSPLEAWKPILDKRDKDSGLGELENDPTPRGVTFEGSFNWMVHTAAFKESQWRGVQEWNPATSARVEPDQSVQFGVRFFVAPDVRSIESTLADHHRPVAVGIPGYVLPEDIKGRLFLEYPSAVQSMDVEPVGSLSIHDDGQLPSGLHAYTICGAAWGESRLRITYEDGTVQTVAYRTIKSERQAVADLGRFVSEEQWYEDKSDPFRRSPSFISYDREASRLVLQDKRVWIAGLSDEGGAGPFLAAAMKELLQPNRDEVARLEEFVDGVLWGHLQIAEGDHQYGVRKSLFYYTPDPPPGFTYDPAVNPKNGSWDKREAFRLDRTYNYPHVVATYWALYRIARNAEGLVIKHSWAWYLDQAYRTTMAMKTEAGLFSRFGLMEGTVFKYLLDDMRKEGWKEKADSLEAYMHERTECWRSEAYPFGSEMPWDSTGQEEVYAWSKHFGYQDKARVTLNAILGYDPTIPNWGYNGSARRYWDFGTAGKWDRIERQLHHYGSGLNAIPLLTEFRQHPDDLYLLRVGYGGVMGPLTNIDQQGFGSAAFHSFPDRMAFDPYSGDYGSNFFGHAVNTGVYVAKSPTMGWLCFGGNLLQDQNRIIVSVLDSSRKRVFIAPLKLWINLDSGEIESFEFDNTSKTVKVRLAPATSFEKEAILQLVDSSTPSTAHWHIDSSISKRGNEFTLPLTAEASIITIRP